MIGSEASNPRDGISNETAMSETPEPKKRSLARRGCLGCLGAFVLLVVVSVGVVAVVRLLGADTEELLSGPYDPVASAAYQEVLAASGFDGAQVRVIPIKGSDEQLAYIVLDETAGFSGADTVEGNEAAIDNAIRGLAEANRSQDLGVGVVAVEYRDETGQSLFTFAARQETVEAYADGEITRDELLSETEVDLSSFLSQVQQLAEAASE